MLNRWTMTAAAALVCVSGAFAQNATLKVGDKAPKLTIETWVKGKSVDKFESGKVYVVEFWATWCGPCIKGIPHLTEIQKEFKDKKVTVIGVAAAERGTEAKANQTGVESFVRTQGNKMEYTVAFDSDKSMWKDWMTAAQQKGIPCAFLVGSDGKIAWIGHPADGMDAQLKKAVAANKRTGSKNSDSSTQVASNSDGKTDSQTSSQSSSQTSSQSSSDSQSDSKRSSDSQKKSSSDSQKKSSSESQKSSDPK